MASDIKYEIKQHLGTLGGGNNGWSKELNIICWNEQAVPKFDIRAWDKNHEHMSRGITLYADEMRELMALYEAYQSGESEGAGGEEDDFPFLNAAGGSGAQAEAVPS